MAWMNQERKTALAAGLKKIMPKGWKYSLAVRHHSTLVLTISEAPIDLVAQSLCSDEQKKRGYIDVNQYRIDGVFSGKLLKTFKAIRDAMMVGNHDNSDPMTDYFDVGWYIAINVGKWDKPFRCSTAPMMGAQTRWRKEAKARRAQFPLHKNFDELWASLPKCPAGHYRVLGDEFFSMCTLFWLGDYDTLKEAKRRADGLNSLYNWRGYLLDEHGNKVTL